MPKLPSALLSPPIPDNLSKGPRGSALIQGQGEVEVPKGLFFCCSPSLVGTLPKWHFLLKETAFLQTDNRQTDTDSV